MEPERLNDCAMKLLSNGEFDSAQELFYLNKIQNPCCQTYNNLGAFLYDHGMKLCNGKEVSATKYGKRYALKALEYGQDEIVFRNLGRMFFEEHDFQSAYQYFHLSYLADHSECILYNIAISLFGLHEYSHAYACLKKIEMPFSEMIPPLLFSMVFCDRNNMIDCLKTNQYHDEFVQMDLINQMLLLYLCEQYQEIVEMEETLTAEWALSEYEWAVLIDSFTRAGKSEKLSQVISKNIGCNATPYEKYLYKTIHSLRNNNEKRQMLITKYLDTMCFPQIMPCGYYGCNLHRTRWK